MIITCAACQKRYLIERENLGPTGRSVKCVACGHTWQQDPPKDAVRYADLPTNHIMDRKDMKKKRSFGSFFFLVVFLLAVFMGVLTFGRGGVVHVIPAARTIYERLGFQVPTPVEQLAFDKLIPLRIETPGGGYHIVLKGDIVNGADHAQIVPPLTIVVRGACEHSKAWPRFLSDIRRVKDKIMNKNQSDTSNSLCVLDTWTYELDRPRLMPGERTPFQTDPRLAVAGAEDITVEF